MAVLEDGSNPELLALFDKAGKGDAAAAIEAQKIIVEEELGGCKCFSCLVYEFHRAQGESL